MIRDSMILNGPDISVRILFEFSKIILQNQLLFLFISYIEYLIFINIFNIFSIMSFTIFFLLCKIFIVFLCIKMIMQ